jgi:hypothetical protein
MADNQDLIDQLKKLMGQKKSKQFYAKKLGVTPEEITEILRQLRNTRGGIDADELFSILKFEEDLTKREAEITVNVKEQIRTLDELVEKCNIDTKIWNVDRYIQNIWGSPKDPCWQVKAWLSKKSAADNFQKNFIEFLKTYKPTVYQQTPPTFPSHLPKGCLVINKQDQHLNKYDILGDNSIGKRFNAIYNKTKVILEQSIRSNSLEKVFYVIGSDQFNAEWTGNTTKGTKQENLTTYHQTFESICNHELNMINLLLNYSKDVEILYVSGNHDEYAGWHLINWLKAYYNTSHKLKFDTSPRYRKYARYGKNALMFNHGDAIKPPKLANIFPIEFKGEWSSCDNYYIFTGDKHHEITMDFHGITFFQLPALSKAKSFWDDKQGHTCTKAELVAFLIDETDGVTGILKQKV